MSKARNSVPKPLGVICEPTHIWAGLEPALENAFASWEADALLLPYAGWAFGFGTARKPAKWGSQGRPLGRFAKWPRLKTGLSEGRIESANTGTQNEDYLHGLLPGLAA